MLERPVFSIAVLLVLVIGACSLEAAPAASSSDSGTTNPDGGLYVHQLMPPSGTVQGGSQIIVRGGGFEPGASVTFGTLPAMETTFLDAQDLMTFTPPSPAGAVDVTVENPDGGEVVVPLGFFFTP